MKFTTYLKEIDHVSIYPTISLIIFFSVFVAVLLYVLFSDKKDMDEKGEIPFH